MGYYLAPSLSVLRAEINQRWPGRDKTSDGWIGDPAHQATRSDHNPNERGSVNAIDVDEDGVDVWAIIAAFERHPSAHYWIYERLIADRDDGWRRRPYYGTNPHDKHVHLSIRQSSTAEQDTRPWGLLEDDMPIDQTDVDRIAAATASRVWTASYGPVETTSSRLGEARDEARKARLTSEAVLAAVKGLDTAAVLARIDDVAQAEAQRDAELVELVRQYRAGALDAVAVADELARRLAS